MYTLSTGASSTFINIFVFLKMKYMGNVSVNTIQGKQSYDSVSEKYGT